MTWLVDADVKEPQIEPIIVASGGEQSQIVVNGQPYRVHTYRVGMFAPFTLDVETGGIADVLLVGAGGAGGDVATIAPSPVDFISAGAGGGGGGGVIEAKFNLENNTLYSITVGSSSGADSYIQGGTRGELRAKGGGKGGSITLTASGNAITDGEDGASSGGGAFIQADNYARQTTNAGQNIFGQGNKGLDAVEDLLDSSGGGGGAGSSAPLPSEIQLPGNGGNGTPSSITGSLVFYGGGGGGGNGWPVDISRGGSGGGGNGGRIFIDAENGTNGLGGGGGGGGLYIGPSPVSESGQGGSGIVIIRYPIEG